MRDLAALLDAWEGRAADAGGVSEAALALLSAAEGADPGTPAPLWHRFLDTTRRPRFLLSLPSREARHRWAEAAFAAVRASRYTLATMLGQRVREHPGRALFHEPASPGAAAWSYESVAGRLERTAAALLRSQRGRPRVAILSANGLDGASADLACLVHGIPVAPLNPETEPEALGWILDRLRVNVVVAETDELRARAERAPGAPRHVAFVLDPGAPLRGAAEARLAEAVAGLAPAQVARALEGREEPSLDEPATVMFTSGSTGRPKGVVHTGLALVTKRFARAAALPAVGEGEVLLAYLPLFHTFGRYLEMLGTAFWGGTYVFLGNPSFESLARALPEVRPTGLVGVPRRWEQLRERCLARGEGDEALRAVVGDRLRWGLSAAGHLDAAVFRYFQRHGVELCSGFGMTEGTGGITMTPPGEYEDASVGVPLPGIEARLSPIGELEIAGPYVARYLEDPAPAPGEKRWLRTGDIFVRRPSGHLEIVDRVKDVYKNTRGQTVAPAAVERRLADVPGVKRAFLVGDGRDHNVLLIVPDRRDPVLCDATPEAEEAYFSELVAAVNREVATPERVVRFALLDRDFDPERELTPKGTYRRKEITRSFAAVIDDLYRSDAVEVPCGPVRARLPRWFFRDLGLLEADVVAHGEGLLERRSGRALAVAGGSAPGSVRVGDLEYGVDGDVVDLGLFARQPLLWGGNPSLRAFAPCKDGWDVPLGRVSPRVRLPEGRGPAPLPGPEPATPLRDAALREAHEASARALFGDGGAALDAVGRLADLLSRAEPRLAGLVRRRLETLAWHPDLDVRCLAYRTLLLDEPVPGYGELLASFVESGRPFLTEASVEAIARARPDTHHLEALRRRLLGYRRDLDWPSSTVVRATFRDVLSLLSRSARLRPAHLVPVRAELAAWALFDREPELAAAARTELSLLAVWCRARYRAPPGAPELHGPVPESDRERLAAAVGAPSFLAESVALAYDETEAAASLVGAGGVWLSPLPSTHGHGRGLYRASFEGADGRHRDLLLSVRGDLGEPAVEETTLWMAALGDPPEGQGVVPRFGAARGDLDVLSTAFAGGLTVEERLRALAEAHELGEAPDPGTWRFLLVRGIAAFFAGWHASEGRILPGRIVPANVVVPEADYRSDVRILSLGGWHRYEGPASLVDPMRRHFFEQPAGHDPALRARLDPLWIAEAAAEALGPEGAGRFLDDLLAAGGGGLDVECVRAFRAGLRRAYRPPLALEAAIGRYARWRAANPRAASSARRQLAARLLRLHGLEARGDLARYTLYRHTYFAEATEAARAALDALLLRLFERPGEPPTRLVELSAV
jgi:long-subunit acyl-CoA synthetase (AMP-forming)